MRDLPNLGETRRVWPALGARVQDGEGRYGRFLAEDGREVVWDLYWHRRYLDGAIMFHDPRPASPPAKDEE